jgi:hypothetical protein
MKTSLLILFFLGIIFNGYNLPAASKDTVHRVSVKLVKVERSPGLARKSVVVGGRYWRDDLFKTTWQPYAACFMLVLDNRRDSDVTIAWKKSWIIDENGKQRTLIQPTRLDGSKGSSKTSTIPRGGELKVALQPVDYVKSQEPLTAIGSWYFIDEQFISRSSWVFPIFKTKYGTKAIKKLSKKHKKKTGKDFDLETYLAGNQVQVQLNMNIDNTDYTYRFYFQPYLWKVE